MIRTFTAATTDSMTARMGARRLMRPHSMVATHLSHGSCAGINEQYRRADSISAAMCQIADPTRYGKYAVTVQTILRFPDHHLRAAAQRVVVFDEDLCSLATDLNIARILLAPRCHPIRRPNGGGLSFRDRRR